MARPVLTFTAEGIYCPAGDFHIDPWRPVPRALITHGHSDHARWGMRSYLATDQALPVIRRRLGDITAEGIAFGEPRRIGGATVSFHPAGHVPGSAQIRVEVGGEVWVVSGDYKTEPDGLAEPFEPVPCHAFISECTFGLPIFRWEPQPQVMARIRDWWAANAAQGKTSILGAYSFGKAQRLLAGLAGQGPILTHGAVEEMTQVLRSQGYALPETIRVTPEVTAKTHPGALGHRPALCPRFRLVRPSRPGGRGLRVRLDGRPRHPPPPRAGDRLRPLGPRRLARPQRRDQGDRG
jgi:putative mRNA 3-end processing factor